MITGGSSGIGLATAKRFVEEGAYVFITGRRQAERIVLQRKNSLFVGSPRGGRTEAILASLTSTWRRHEIDPQLYLTQLLMNLPGLSSSQLADWAARSVKTTAECRSD